MKFRNLVILSIILIVIYLFVAKGDLYRQVFSKIIEWMTKGIQVLTTGGVKE